LVGGGDGVRHRRELPVKRELLRSPSNADGDPRTQNMEGVRHSIPIILEIFESLFHEVYPRAVFSSPVQFPWLP
jgi:hypothetical protein